MAANPSPEALKPQRERELAPAVPVSSPSEISPEIDDSARTVGSQEQLPPEPDAGSRQEAIARAAYFAAQARGFEPGHELDDWLAAEQAMGPR